MQNNKSADTLPKPVTVGRGRHSTKPTFSVEELQRHEPIPIEQIPEWNNRGQFSKRRWQPMAEDIVELSSRGRALPITVPIGIETEIVQSGIREELKRFNHKLHTRKIINIDGTTTMYFFGEALPNLK